MHYLLLYEVVSHYRTRRMGHRSEHVEHARRAVERRELVLGGALANPIDGAVLLFRGWSPAFAERFAAEDLCVQGLVAGKHQMRQTHS